MKNIRHDLSTVNTEFPDADGDWEPTEEKCRGCGEAGNVRYLIWESSCGGYEDYKYKCGKCGKTWWVEGIDA